MSPRTNTSSCPAIASIGERKRPSDARHARHRPVRAFCGMDREETVRERTVILGYFLTETTEIARALRETRKAAMGRALHYDPARHAALLRLARAHDRADGAPFVETCGGPRGPKR